jgi:poly [ADP-ribose] polymerase 7/11/12/13
LLQALQQCDEVKLTIVLSVQVIVGDYTKSNKSIVHPPPKDPSQPMGDLFDSCVDDVNDPKIFVTFERWQAYPEYLLQY